MGAGAVLGAGVASFLFFRKKKQTQKQQAQDHNQDHNKEGQA
jgi:mannose/fructose/N-acetylgalactosamine-specific phosphotransferase system component IIC